MQNFSVSAANLFKSCPRLYYYREILGFEPAVQPTWLKAGSAYDKLLEHYDLLGVEGANSKIPELFSNPYEQLDAQYILSRYHAAFEVKKYPPVEGGNQFGFGIPFYGNEITGPVAFKVTGYMDKVSQEGDELIVTERKTTSESIEPGSEYWKKLPLDPQILCYQFAMRALGNNCGWTNYEVLRKPSTTVSSKFKKDCTVEEYRDRLMHHEEKKTLVARKLVYTNQDMVDSWITDHALTFLQIQECKRRQAVIEEAGYEGVYAWTMHTKSCNDYGGCAFRSVDEGLVTLEQGDFVKSQKWLKKQGAVK